MIERRGVVINFDEIHDDLLELLVNSSINVVGLHNLSVDGRFENKIDEMIDYMYSSKGLAFQERLRTADIDLEYEIHAMSWLLPRKLFDTRPQLFRMDDKGDRNPDSNCCPSHQETIAIIQKNSIQLAQKLKPTTHRYYLWQDDNKPWCHCEQCERLTASDQSLLLMNKILEAIRSVDEEATLSFLAYMNTLDMVPQQVKPSDGIFLEITGPSIHHRQDQEMQKPQKNEKFQRALDNQLAFFGPQNAHVLEYWLDASMHSGWKKPAVKLEFDEKEIREEMEFYASKGFRSITTFGVFLDEEYFRMYGNPPIQEYGDLLKAL